MFSMPEKFFQKIMKLVIRVIILIVAINTCIVVYNLFFTSKIIKEQIILGWPYIYYRYFDLKYPGSAVHGWDVGNFIIDQAFYLAAVFLGLISFRYFKRVRYIQYHYRSQS